MRVRWMDLTILSLWKTKKNGKWKKMKWSQTNRFHSFSFFFYVSSSITHSDRRGRAGDSLANVVSPATSSVPIVSWFYHFYKTLSNCLSRPLLGNMPDLGKIEKQQPEEHFDQLEDTTHRFVVIIVVIFSSISLYSPAFFQVYLLLLTVIVANYLFNPFQLNCDLLTMFTVFFCCGIMLPFGFLCFSFIRFATKQRVTPMHRTITSSSSYSSRDSDPAFWIGINN